MCDYNGNTYTFKASCFNFDTSDDGQMICNVRYKDYMIFTTVSSLRGSPYSVKICGPNNSVDFQASELESVYEVINKIDLCAREECECTRCNYFDIPVWGGAMKLRFSLFGDEGFIFGFTITEIHDRLNKEYIRHSGYHPKILPPMRRCKRDIFVDVDNIHHFCAVIKRTYIVHC